MPQIRVGFETIDSELAALVDRWCERRALRPLRFLLPHYPAARVLTDDWDALALCLKTIRVDANAELVADEIERVIALQQFAEAVVDRRT